MLEQFDKRIAAVAALQADKGSKMEEIEGKGQISVDGTTVAKTMCEQADDVGKILKDLLAEYKDTQEMMVANTNDMFEVLEKLNAASSTLQSDKTSQMLAGSCS